MGYLQSMFGGATELNFFPSSAYGETFKVLIFFAVFPRISYFVTMASCWLKIVLCVDVASPRDFVNSSLVPEKCFVFQ